MFFIMVSVMLLAYSNAYTAERKKYDGWFTDDIGQAEEVLKNTIFQNDCAKDRIDHVKELKDEAFDRVELWQALARNDAEQLIENDVNKLMHNGIVDLTQNMTKMVIASSLGIGAVIALYQAAKAAITIAYARDEQQDKQQYVTMYSYAGVATLCATCSMFCYWSIN